MIKAILLNYTPEPERNIALAGRLCYSKSGIEELKENMSDEKVAEMIRKLVDSGHHSTLEHSSFTFGIEGVSRALTHQLVRHRLASYSQKSQRYVKEKQFEYIVPDSINDILELKEKYDEFMLKTQEFYNLMLAKGIPAEDARFVLPNAAETKIIVTMNVRELIHFFEHRLCNRAQWEIRELAEKMLVEVKAIAPNLFENIGPACVNGVCPEGNFSCGKIAEMKRRYGEEK